MAEAAGKRLDVDPKTGLPRLAKHMYWEKRPAGEHLRLEIRRKTRVGSRLIIGGYAHLRGGEDEIPKQRIWETAVTLLWRMAIQSDKPNFYSAQRFLEE